MEREELRAHINNISQLKQSLRGRPRLLLVRSRDHSLPLLRRLVSLLRLLHLVIAAPRLHIILSLLSIQHLLPLRVESPPIRPCRVANGEGDPLEGILELGGASESAEEELGDGSGWVVESLSSTRRSVAHWRSKNLTLTPHPKAPSTRARCRRIFAIRNSDLILLKVSFSSSGDRLGALP